MKGTLKGRRTTCTVLAETYGAERLWVVDEEHLARHGGLVWNGSTGAQWSDSLCAPFLVRRDDFALA